MKTRVLVAALVLGFKCAQAQLAPQLFAGHRNMEYNFLWYKNVDEKARVSLFNFTSFRVDYKSKANNQYEIYQAAIYNINRNFGLSGGGRFIQNEFVPLVALSFQVFSQDLYLNVFPSVQLPEGGQANYSVFGLLFYTPKISDRWKLYNQLTFEPLFNADQHIYSYQQVRVGLEYAGKVQFGLGANFDQYGSEFDSLESYGVFVRKVFE